MSTPLLTLGIALALVSLSLCCGAAFHFGAQLWRRWRNDCERRGKWKGLLK